MKPFVVLLTGRSGSGKTTIAKALMQEFHKAGVLAECIDGDDTRQMVGGILGHSKEDRVKMGRINRAIGHYLVKNQINVIYALVCPYEEIREAFRQFFGRAYVEVYVSASSDICARRDVKGLYDLSRQGKLDHLNGMNEEFEEPKNCDVIVDTEHLSVDQAKWVVIDYLRRNHYIS